MYGARGLVPGFLNAAAAAVHVSAALQQGGLVGNSALTESLRGLDLERATGLSAILSPDHIRLLNQLRRGSLDRNELPDAKKALARLELAAAAANYHMAGRPGKVEVRPTVPLRGFDDLKKAYSPGVAYPSRLIRLDPRFEAAFTNVLNTVWIVSDGSAVLGDGALGSKAFHPVGEGKAVLMKMFAGLDAISVPLNFPGFKEIYIDETASPELTERYINRIVDWVMAGRDAFGAVNLEDISNKTCFKILGRLQKDLGRLIWHDDQQGTAMVLVAAILVALRVQGKYSQDAIRNLNIRIAGAGAAGISCARLLYKALSNICPEFSRSRIMLRDSRGAITTGRKDLSPEKRVFAVNAQIQDDEAFLRDADIFIGVSPVGTFKLTPDQLRSMRPRRIIFAMANPDPEILPEEVDEVCSDAVCGTGRADRRNQANNSNSFPGVLAGGLDVGATVSTDDMALAGALAMAEVALAPVLAEVQALYDYELRPSSPCYLVPSAFDPRVHYRVAHAVGRAAVAGGVASFDFDEAGYRDWFFHNRLSYGLIQLANSSLL